MVTAPTNILTSPSAITELICKALGWTFWFFIVASIVMGMVAAFYYLTSNGDPEKVNKATKTLLYVAIAIVVALMAKGMPILISNIIGGGLSGTAC